MPRGASATWADRLRRKTRVGRLRKRPNFFDVRCRAVRCQYLISTTVRPCALTNSAMPRHKLRVCSCGHSCSYARTPGTSSGATSARNLEAACDGLTRLRHSLRLPVFTLRRNGAHGFCAQLHSGDRSTGRDALRHCAIRHLVEGCLYLRRSETHSVRRWKLSRTAGCGRRTFPAAVSVALRCVLLDFPLGDRRSLHRRTDRHRVLTICEQHPSSRWVASL